MPWKKFELQQLYCDRCRKPGPAALDQDEASHEAAAIGWARSGADWHCPDCQNAPAGGTAGPAEKKNLLGKLLHSCRELIRCEAGRAPVEPAVMLGVAVVVGAIAIPFLGRAISTPFAVTAKALQGKEGGLAAKRKPATQKAPRAHGTPGRP